MVRKSKKKVTSSDTGTPAAVQGDGAYQAGNNPSPDAADDAAQHASDQPDETEQSGAPVDGAYQHTETPDPDASENSDAEKPADEQPQERGQDVAPANETPQDPPSVGDTDRGAAEAAADEHEDSPTAEDQQDAAGDVEAGPKAETDATDSDGGTGQPDEPEQSEDGVDRIVASCGDVGFSAYYHALSLVNATSKEAAATVSNRFLEPDQTGEMADLIAAIGDRATVEVLAQQLVIAGLRETADLTAPERIGITIFASTLRELKQLQDELAEPDEVAAAEPRKVPLDETTMEPTDGLMDAWR